MVRVCLFVHIYGSNAGSAVSMETLADRIKEHVVDVLIDGERLQLFAGLRVEGNDLFTAATHKQAMLGDTAMELSQKRF